MQKEQSFLQSGICEGLVGSVPVAYSLPDTHLCQNYEEYMMHNSDKMEDNEDLKLYEQPLPTDGEEVSYPKY